MGICKKIFLCLCDRLCLDFKGKRKDLCVCVSGKNQLDRKESRTMPAVTSGVQDIQWFTSEGSELLVDRVRLRRDSRPAKDRIKIPRHHCRIMSNVYSLKRIMARLILCLLLVMRLYLAILQLGPEIVMRRNQQFSLSLKGNIQSRLVNRSDFGGEPRTCETIKIPMKKNASINWQSLPPKLS